MDFDVSWWKVAVWAASTLGIVGIIAVIVVYPIIAKAIGTVLVRLFSFVFSYRIGCALVAAIVAAIIADYVRHSIDDDRHAAEIAAFEKAQDERDARIAHDTREWVLKEIADAPKQDAPVDKDVKDFTDALPKLPEGQPPVHAGNVFRVGDDAARLRKIAGQVERGPGSAQGMPQADTGHASIRDRIRNRLPSAIGGSARRDEQGKQGNRSPESLRR